MESLSGQRLDGLVDLEISSIGLLEGDLEMDHGLAFEDRLHVLVLDLAFRTRKIKLVSHNDRRNFIAHGILHLDQQSGTDVAKRRARAHVVDVHNTMNVAEILVTDPSSLTTSIPQVNRERTMVGLEDNHGGLFSARSTSVRVTERLSLEHLDKSTFWRK